jgi:hypothetical protein
MYFENHNITDHKEGEQLEEWRNVGESNCNSGDGADKRAQSFIIIMMMMIFWKQGYVTAKSLI